MEEFMKSNLLLGDIDDLRNYLRVTNVDIFDFLKMAIRVAAADHPDDFQIARDNIAEVLYRSSSNKLPYATSTKNNNDEDNREWRRDVAANEVVDQEEQKQDMPTTKPSFKIRLKVKRNPEKDNVAKGPHTPDLIVENSTNNVIDQVLRIKKVIDKSMEDESVLCDSLKKLQNIEMSVETLEKTGIGKTVSLLRKHTSNYVSETAMKLVKTWKDMVDETMKKKKKSSPVSETVTRDHSNMKTREDQTSITREKKLEVSTKKLHRSYREIESMKNKRKIQVLQLHQLPPQPVNKRLKR